MKKAVAVVLVVVMMLAFGATAFAAGPLTLEQAKKVALDFTGVKTSEATFTKAYKTFDDGREVYEIEFFANYTEYEMDVDVYTGRVTDFNTEYFGGYSQPSYNAPYGYYYEYDYDDYFDFDDRYDFGDMFDFDLDFD